MRRLAWLSLLLLGPTPALAAVTVNVNGTPYTIPQTNEKGWGTNVTTWIQAISSNTLQPSSGTFTLGADLDFGPTYGLKPAYVKSRGTNPATAGVVRLINADTIGWRNAGNTADLPLGVNSSNQLTFGGNPVVGSTALTVSRALQSDATGAVASSSVLSSELAFLSGVTSSLCGINQSCVVTNKSIDATTNTLTNIGNASIASGAAIAYSKLNLTGLVVNADVSTSAAIAVTKLAALSPSIVPVTDVSGKLASSTVTATTLGFLDATSSVQTQLNGKQTSGSYITGITGDVVATGPGSVVSAIQANVVTNAQRVQMGTNTIKGNSTGATANEADLSVTTVTSMLNAVVGDAGSGGTKGLVPAPAAGDAAAGKFLKANGTWATAGGGSGGGLNFVALDSTFASTKNTNSDFEVSIGDWAAYSNGASTVPTTMTGGAPGTTIARVTSGPLNGAASAKVDLGTGSSRQGEGVSVLVNVPTGYVGSTVSFSLPFSITGAIVDGDIVPFAYDVTNSTLITPYLVSKVLGTTGRMLANFPISTNTAQMRVGLHVARTSTTALSFLMDDVKVSPDVPAYGLAGSNTLNGSSTFTINNFGTVTSTDIRYTRVGDRLNVVGMFISGTATAASASIQLPAGLVIDSTKITTTSQAQKVGTLIVATTAINSFAGANPGPYPVFYDGSTTDRLFIAGGTQTSALTKTTGSNIALSGNPVSFDFSIPILGWDANVTMGSSSTYRISSFLANGTRVTGTAPTLLGQYRSYLRNAGASTYTETSGAPTNAPTVSNGIWLNTVGTNAAADPSGQPSKYEIFVGKNKNVKAAFYASTGMTGYLDATPYGGGTVTSGCLQSYDPTTGVYTVQFNANGNFANNILGYNVSAGTAAPALVTTGYFDIVVSENALAVGIQAPRAQLKFYGHAGYGSTLTKTPYYTNVDTSKAGTAYSYSNTTTGLQVTILESGVYAVSMTSGSATATSIGIGVTMNDLTANAPSLVSATQRLAWTYIGAITSAIAIPNASGQEYLAAGTVITPKVESATVPTDVTYNQFTITKVSN